MTGAYYYVFDRNGRGSNYPPRSLFLQSLGVFFFLGKPGRVLKIAFIQLVRNKAISFQRRSYRYAKSARQLLQVANSKTGAGLQDKATEIQDSFS